MAFSAPQTPPVQPVPPGAVLGLVAQRLAVAVAHLQLLLGDLAPHSALRQDAPRQLARGEGQAVTAATEQWGLKRH